MSRRFAFRFAPITLALVGALCFTSVACSGGSGGPTDPRDPVPPVEPGPPQPNIPSIAGTYGLTLVNNLEPGRIITVANPDGGVIGLYRFREYTTLTIREDQTWKLEIHFEDESNSHVIADDGRLKRLGEDLTFNSAVFGDQFMGKAKDGVATFKYDMDGDGEAETIFGFQLIESRRLFRHRAPTPPRADHLDRDRPDRRRGARGLARGLAVGAPRLDPRLTAGA